jgi:hypothetical protein
MTVIDCDGNRIEKGALVQSPRNHRAYHVLRIKANGRLVLYKHGWPRIRNADPSNWRLMPRLVEVSREPAG